MSLFFSITFSASTIENRSLSLFQHGRDADGIIIYDRIEIFPDLKVVWQTASKGTHCPDQAGTFIGQVSQETFAEIFKLAQTVENDKGVTKSTQAPPKSREVSTSLTLESGGRIRAITINEFTESMDALNEELAYLRSTLAPSQGVRMQAVKVSKGVRVTFSHLGMKPFRLLIPKIAGEAFFLQGKAKISFTGTPKKRNVMLSRDLTAASYEIKTSLPTHTDKSKKQFLFYSGAALAHHGDAASDGKLPRAQEVALCAEF